VFGCERIIVLTGKLMSVCSCLIPLYLSSLIMPIPFPLEQQVAIAAVRRACALTTTVFNKLVVGETLVKGDKSPVTGAL
jgi:hypothetical protein